MNAVLGFEVRFDTEMGVWRVKWRRSAVPASMGICLHWLYAFEDEGDAETNNGLK